MTYFFETYGCQMNKAESARFESLLESRGWQHAPGAQTADLVLINTCSVRETAETRVRGRLGWYAALKAVRNREKNAKNAAFPEAAVYAQENSGALTLVVTGCMAERLAGALKDEHPEVDYVMGNFQKKQFARIVQAVENAAFYQLGADEPFDFAGEEFAPHTRGDAGAYVPIMHGCDNFCSYCIVPFVRGRETSRPPASVIRELDFLSRDGVKEITLLGQNVNSYRFEQCDFPSLLSLILAHLEKTNSSIRWVRFLTSHPKDLSPRLIDLFADDYLSGGRLCRHIHLPVQHGANSVLGAMNRGYTREHYLDLVRLIREKIPDVSLSTDILVGFPGESQSDVEQTIALMRKARFEAAYTYYFNPREGTPAALLPNQIPLEAKKERLARVIDAHLEISRQEMARRLGKDALVLVEGVSRDNPHEYIGRTEHDGHAAFASPQHNPAGGFVSVRLCELTGNTFRGKIIEYTE